jgi:hypothetical protein
MVEIGERIRRDALRPGNGIVLDVCQHSDFPVSLEATTGRLIFSARKHSCSLVQNDWSLVYAIWYA